MNKIAILEGYRGLPRRRRRRFGTDKTDPQSITDETVDLVQRGQHPFMPMAVEPEDILGPIDDSIFHPDKAKAAQNYKKRYKARVDALKHAGIKPKIIQKLKTLPRFVVQKNPYKVSPAASKFINIPDYPQDGELVSLVSFPKPKKPRKPRASRAKTTVAAKPAKKRKTKTRSARGGGGGNASSGFTKCVQICHRKFGRKKRKCPDNKFIRCLRKHKGKTNFRGRVKRCMGKGWSWKKKK